MSAIMRFGRVLLMKDWIRQGSVALFLILLGVAARLWFREIPNFAPISAIALFAGFYWSGSIRAFLVPVASLAIGDLFLSGYEPQLRVIVYASLTAPVFLHAWVADGMHGATHGNFRSRVANVGRLFSCGLACSVLFYVVTNMATWAFTPWYTKDAAGLAQCMFAGLPFFRYTVAGDLTFGLLLFSGYALVGSVAADFQKRSHPANLTTATIDGPNG
jgi:hypothetical protein